MASNETILIAVDESSASEKAVAYVGRFVSRCTQLRLCLLHVLPPVPPRLLEYGGVSTADEKLSQRSEVEKAKQAWIKEKEENTQPKFDKLRRILEEADVPEDSVFTCCYAPHPGESAASGILASQCGGDFKTIAVGRETFPWYFEMFHRHVGEDILRKGKDLAIWIVE